MTCKSPACMGNRRAARRQEAWMDVQALCGELERAIRVAQAHDTQEKQQPVSALRRAA